MRKRSRILTVIASLPVAMALNAAAPQVWAAGTDAAHVSHHTSIAGQVALRGQVTDMSGRGVAGARIVLYAWPAEWQSKQALRPGETVPLRQVGQAVSTADGQYAVRIAAPVALSDAATSGGVVNLQASVINAGAGTGFYAFSLRIKSTTSGPVLTSLSAQGAAAGLPQTAVLRVSRLLGNSARTPNDFCFVRHTAFVKNFAKTYATIDETFMRKSGMSATATRDSGQNTSFSVGFSGSGGKGSFTDSGSFSWSSDLTVQFDTFRGPSSQLYQSQFTPGLYKVWYTPGNCTLGYFTQPDHETGAYRVVQRVRIPNARHCVAENHVHSITWSKTRAATISAGMTISAIGFTASTQTGWTTTDTITYTNIAHKVTWYLCGLHADPGSGSPGVLVTQ